MAAPQPPVAPQGTPGPSTFRQAMSEALVSGGGGILAEQFGQDDPAIGQAIAGITDASVQMMQQRFWKNEYENFSQTYGKQYQLAAQQVWQSYEAQDQELGSDFSDKGIQARAQAQRQLFSQVQQLDTQFMQNAAKFPNNPQIGNVANQLMQQRSQWMQQTLGAYGDVVGNAEHTANLKKAQFQVSPEMQALEVQGKKADVTKTGAETAELGARATLERAEAGKAAASITDKEFSWPPKDVPVGKLDQYLLTDPKGNKVLEPYQATVESRYKDRIMKQFPKESAADPGFVERKLVEILPQIRKEAVVMALQDTLPSETFNSLLTSNARIGGALLRDNTPTDGAPSIVQKYSQPEIDTMVQGQKNEAGLGETLVLKGAEAMARKEDIKDINELKNKVRDAIIEDVQSMVGDFSGNREVKTRLATAMIKYFDDNWNRSPYLRSEFKGEEPGLLGMAKKLKSKYAILPILREE